MGCLVGVCVGRQAERGPSRELNSLVLTHIDIKFTAMLSFIQVAINSLRFWSLPKFSRVIFANGKGQCDPVGDSLFFPLCLTYVDFAFELLRNLITLWRLHHFSPPFSV